MNVTEPALRPAPSLPGAGPNLPQKILIAVAAVGVAVLGWFGVQSIAGMIAPKTTIAQSAETYRYENSDHGFAVDFPGKPSEHTENQSAVGIDLEVLLVQWVNGVDVSMVQAIEFPPEILDQDVEVLLADSIAAVASSSGAATSGEKTTELDGAPARVASLTFDNGDVAQILVAINGVQQVTLMVTGDASLTPFAASFAFSG